MKCVSKTICRGPIINHNFRQLPATESFEIEHADVWSSHYFHKLRLTVTFVTGRGFSLLTRRSYRLRRINPAKLSKPAPSMVMLAGSGTANCTLFESCVSVPFPSAP
jgi:hypothetical protein